MAVANLAQVLEFNRLKQALSVDEMIRAREEDEVQSFWFLDKKVSAGLAEVWLGVHPQIDSIDMHPYTDQQRRELSVQLKKIFEYETNVWPILPLDENTIARGVLEFGPVISVTYRSLFDNHCLGEVLGHEVDFYTNRRLADSALQRFRAKRMQAELDRHLPITGTPDDATLYMNIDSAREVFGHNVKTYSPDFSTQREEPLEMGRVFWAKYAIRRHA